MPSDLDSSHPPGPRSLAEPSFLMTLLLSALGMMGPFSIDTYLPSFHEVERTLQATPLQVQQSLTFFLVPFSFMSLWHGSISDAFGRRRVIIVALSILCVASIGCALSQSIEMLWAFRIVQGLSAGVFVVGRAVVRDLYSGPAATRVLAQVSVLFAIAPAIAPILGGQLHEWFGWRSVFLFLACFSGGIAVWTAVALPESLPPSHRHPLHARHLLRAYWRTLTHPGFFASALAMALTFTGLFVYVASVNPFLVTHLHLRETQFFWLFGPITSGLMLGGWLSGRMAGKMSGPRTLVFGCGSMIGGATANVLFHLFHAAALPWSVAPIFFYASGLAFILPTLTLLCLDYFPRHRGLAASCQAFLLTGANALTAGVISPLVSVTPLSLTVCSAVMMTLGLACLPFVRRGPLGDDSFPVPVEDQGGLL